MSRVAGDVQTTPLIYSRIDGARKLGVAGRFVAALVALACLTLLSLAFHLQPSPEGTGTHTALGLASCQFMARTGLPCPSCGMTTSFSWFVRGNFLASIYIQPMGFVLAVLVTACMWTAAYVAITAKPAHQLLRLIPYQRILIPLMLFAIAAWGWKMFIHLKGIDGWM